MAGEMKYAVEVAEMVGGEAQFVNKNGNDVWAVVIGTGMVRPTVYVNDFIRDGLSVTQASELIKKKLEETNNEKSMAFAAKLCNNFDEMLKEQSQNLFLRIMHKKAAENGYVYTPAGACGFEDLILVPYFDLGDGMKTAIKKSHVEAFKLDPDAIFDIALKNTRYEISDYMGMTVVRDELSGAAGIVKAREELKKLFPEGYWAIPSSIHEFLIVPTTMPMTEEELTALIKEVNAGHVDRTEWLSDHPYKFEP
jgi:hypothetical protein